MEKNSFCENGHSSSATSHFISYKPLIIQILIKATLENIPARPPLFFNYFHRFFDSLNSLTGEVLDRSYPFPLPFQKGNQKISLFFRSVTCVALQLQLSSLLRYVEVFPSVAACCNFVLSTGRMLVEFANSPTSAMTISITSSNTIANSN
jgi:hypothetical protein